MKTSATKAFTVITKLLLRANLLSCDLSRILVPAVSGETD